ncbi:MAG: hypothetical protein ACOX1O_07480 [Eggerthellaceae bacterium]
MTAASGNGGDKLVLGKDLFIADNAVSVSENARGNIFAAGNSVKFSRTTGPNIFAAGQTVHVLDSAVAYDLFAAGQTVSVDSTIVNGNIFAAAQDISLSGVRADTIATAGQDINVQADEVTDASLSGQTVTLAGTYEGDVNVDAETVNIDGDVTIKGTLTVASEQEPSIPSTAEIGDYTFQKKQNDDSLAENLGASLAVGGTLWFVGIFIGILAMLLLMVVMLAVCTPRPFEDSLDMVKTHPAPMLLSGLIALVAIPIVAILCLFTLIGWRLGATLGLLAFIIATVSATFTAIAIGRLAFPRMKVWLSSLLMVLIFAVALKIPVLGSIVGICCDIYLLGFIIQTYWHWRNEKHEPAGAPLPATPAQTAAGTATAGSAASAPAPTPTPSAEKPAHTQPAPPAAQPDQMQSGGGAEAPQPPADAESADKR